MEKKASCYLNVHRQKHGGVSLGTRWKEREGPDQLTITAYVLSKSLITNVPGVGKHHISPLTIIQWV